MLGVQNSPIASAPLSPRHASIRKFFRMLKLAGKHQGTHIVVALIASLVAFYLTTRRAARQLAQRRIINDLMHRFESSKPVSRVQSAKDLNSLGAWHPSSSELWARRTRSLVDMSVPSDADTPPMRRKASALALVDLCAVHDLCDRCLSRCATHDSRARLDEDSEPALSLLGELDGDGVGRPPVMATPTTAETLMDADTVEPRPSTPTTADAVMATNAIIAAFDDPPQIPEQRCEVCKEVVTSWRQMLHRVLGATTGGLVTYALWLRFVASRETVRRHVSALVRFMGEKVFRYRVTGAEHIPKTGPALLCCYHGFIPLDMYFFHEYVSRVTGRTPTTLVADFVFRIPIFGYLVRCCGGCPASRRAALEALSKGGLVLVAPGGVREGITTSAEDYVLRWFGKVGFAEMSARTGSPIVPIFTRRIREVFLVLGGSLPLVQWLYKLTRLPFTPFIGPLPQALTTIVGQPLAPGPCGGDAKQLAAKAVDALTALMRMHADTN
jgi:1-acyl-sn-glycerol-3-phosphate acyltransferase